VPWNSPTKPDPAGESANPDSLTLIDPKTLEQLVLGGYLEEYTGATESHVAFSISALSLPGFNLKHLPTSGNKLLDSPSIRVNPQDCC
jgi:hypothetical protein